MFETTVQRIVVDPSPALWHSAHTSMNLLMTVQWPVHPRHSSLGNYICLRHILSENITQSSDIAANKHDGEGKKAGEPQDNTIWPRPTSNMKFQETIIYKCHRNWDDSHSQLAGKAAEGWPNLVSNTATNSIETGSVHISIVPITRPNQIRIPH